MIKHNGFVVLGVWVISAVVMVLQPIVGMIFLCVAMMTTAAMLEYARQESKAQKALLMLSKPTHNHKVKRNQKKRRAKQTGRNIAGARTW